MQRLTQRIVQQSSLDDPMFMVSPIGEMAETAAGRVETMLSIKQKFPFPGKLNAGGHIAAREAGLARAELERTRLSVAADTRRAYWDLCYVHAAIGITESGRAVLRQMRDTADARLRAGVVGQQDVLRADVELGILEKDLLTLRQAERTAQAMLNTLMGRPVGAPLPAPAKVEPDMTRYEPDDLMAAAVESNPELAGVNERIEMFRQRLRLARLRRLPDLTVGLNYNPVANSGLAPSASGKDQWWIGFELNIPVWLDKLSAGEREAQAGMLEAAGEYDDAKNRLTFRVRDAVLRVQTQQRLVRLFRDTIIPQARQAMDASFARYRADKTDFLTLSDNRRKLLDYQLMYHRALARLGKDLADLRQQIGAPLPRPTRGAARAPTTHRRHSGFGASATQSD